MTNLPMTNLPNYQVDIDMAVLVYKAVQTETYAIHKQNRYIANSPTCETTACIGGHAIILEHGPRREDWFPEIRSRVRSTEMEAARILVGGNYRTFPSRMHHIQGEPDDMTKDEVDMILDLRNSVFLNMDNATVLDDFESWVRKWASDEDYERFQQLTHLGMDDVELLCL